MNYLEILEELKQIKCFQLQSKFQYKRFIIFKIRGTRIYFEINKTTDRVSWLLKVKNYQRSRYGCNYLQTNFETILDHEWLNDSARDELLYHLDFFTKLQRTNLS